MADRVSVDINEIMQSLSPMSAKVCIFRVPYLLREVNKKAYEPKRLAIGPYHDHGKDHLKAMETHKIHYLQLLLKETRENDVSRYVTKLRDLEKEARKCYAEEVGLRSDDFVKMMLLDGCFIVQLIRMRLRRRPRVPNDLVFKVRGLFKDLYLDLLLVENQLPFFVIWELYSMLEICDQNSFKNTVYEFFNNALPCRLRPREDLKINHLLHFIHHYSHHDHMNQRDDWNDIDCATKLEEAGMKFKMGRGNSLFDISFESGTVKIPLVVVEDSTEGFLRNLVAFEQLHLGKRLHHFTDFIVFMDYLIDSAKDVEILRQHGIIKNLLGDNEEVATMFNRLGHHVNFSSKNFYYSEVFNQMKKHCDRFQRSKKCIAYLRRNYLKSPWAPLVSVVAAFTLLLLTLLQTMYSILSYTKQNA